MEIGIIVCFSSFQHHRTNDFQDNSRRLRCHIGSTRLEHAILVSHGSQHGRPNNENKTTPQKPAPDTRSIKTTPTASEVRTTCDQGNYNDTTNSIITASLRESTRKTYGNYIKQWHDFIGNRSGVDINLILDFLSTLF